MQHVIKSWMDGTKREYFCEVCYQDNPVISEPCPGPKQDNDSVGKPEQQENVTDKT